MFNVTVLKMKDIIKYLVGIIITISLVIYATRYFSSIKNKIKEENKKQSKIEIFQIGSLTSCLDKTIPTMSNVNEENNNKENKNYLEQFLKTEISSMNGIEKLEETSKTEDTKTENIDNEDKQETTEQVTVVSNTENVKTEVVTQNPITESYNAEYGKVKIKNQTKYSLTEEILKPDIKIDNKNILIFHTHSCESYTPSEKYQYTQTGNYRTTDLNYTVTRVGTELENYLKQYNINVQHNTSYHDYPSYTGSYTRSLNTVENMLQTTASDIIIDLHRDAIGSRPDYAPTVKIGEEYAAQIMFVIRNK
jgi:stage II sporulation protein P